MESYRGLDTNNGCIRIPIKNLHLDRIVFSIFAVSIHWNDTKKRISPVQNRLISLVEYHNLVSASGDIQNHDKMHFDEDDANTPALHMHIVGNIDTDDSFYRSIKFVIGDLKRKNFLTTDEAIKLDMGMTAFKDWE